MNIQTVLMVIIVIAAIRRSIIVEKKRTGMLVALLCAIMLFINGGNINSAKAKEAVETLDADDVGETSATLVGKVNANGGYDYESYAFWLKEESQPDDDGDFVMWGSGPLYNGKKYEYTVKGLEPGTEYEYYFLAVSSNKDWGDKGTVYGERVSFTTDCDHDYVEDGVDKEEIEYYNEEKHTYRAKIRYVCENCGDERTEWQDEVRVEHEFNKSNTGSCSHHHE